MFERKIYLSSQLFTKIFFTKQFRQVEYGHFKRKDGNFRDRERTGGDRERTGDRDNRDRGNDRDRGGFRERSGGERTGGFNRDGGGGFNRDRGGERGGGFNRDRGGDRGGFRERGGGDFNRDRGDRGDREPEESVFSKRVRAGKRRTYFFDVRKTKGSDFFITITESTRREDGFGYKRHKIFLYKEDFNRFVASLNEVVNHVKTDLMPDFDYEEFDRRQAEWEAQNQDQDFGDDEDQADDTDAPEREEDKREKPPVKDEDEMTW